MNRTSRVLVASGAATLADVATLLALHGERLPAALAAAMGCLCGGLVNYLLTRRLVFRVRRVSAWRSLPTYGGLVVGGGAMWSSVLVHLGTVVLGLPVLLSKSVAAAIVLLGWNYPVSSRVVFKERSAK